jgi:WD40 repeat protein
MGTVLSVAFNPSAPYLATSSMDNTAKLWRLPSDGAVDPSNVLTLTEHNDWKRFVPFVPTGSVFSIMGPWMRSVAFDPTGRFLATSRDDSTVRLWRVLPDGNVHPSPIGILEGHRHEVTSVAFHPSGQFLATGSGDYTVKLWRFPPDRLNPECIETLTGHTSPITSVAFHSNGELLATGSYDNTAKLWDCSKINELLRREALTRASLSAKVIKDFTTGTSDQGLRFSNAAQGRLGNPPDTQENRRKQAEITFKKYKGLPREPISSTPSNDFTQCDSCRANDVDAANWAAVDPEYGVFYNQMSKSRCTECLGESNEADTDQMPGGGRSRKKLKKRLSRKLMIR